MGIKKHLCIALFGGTGERFGAPYPKQFVPLGEDPMLIVTLKGLASCVDIDGIYVVTEASTRDEVYNLVLAKQVKKIRAILIGGKTRQESSRIALEYLKRNKVSNDSLVMIVDGDRPCVDPHLIHRCYQAADDVGNSVAALPVTDSVLISKDGKTVSSYIDRDTVYAVQTPQTFTFSTIYRAHERFKNGTFTDDASIARKAGAKIAIVYGNKDNVKITVPDDIAVYNAWKEKKK